MISAMCGCHTISTATTDTTHHTNTEYVYKYVHDSVYVDRWHTQWMQGDTVYRHDSVVHYDYKYLHDTVRTSDTVRATHTEYKEKVKEKPLPWWSYVITLLASAVVIWEAYRLLKKPVGKLWAKMGKKMGNKWS